MDDIKTDDVIFIRGREYLVVRVLPGGLFICAVGPGSHGQFINDHHLPEAYRNAALQARSGCVADAVYEGARQKAGTDLVQPLRRHVADAICDAVLSCVGPNRASVTLKHRELSAAIQGPLRAALKPPTEKGFRRIVWDMAAAMKRADGPGASASATSSETADKEAA